jgi:hypothetical protein
MSSIMNKLARQIQDEHRLSIDQALDLAAELNACAVEDLRDNMIELEDTIDELRAEARRRG